MIIGSPFARGVSWDPESISFCMNGYEFPFRLSTFLDREMRADDQGSLVLACVVGDGRE